MARPQNLYEELTKLQSDDSLTKTASTKDANQIRQELDEINFSSEKIETLTNELFGITKSAEEVVNPQQEQQQGQSVEETATEAPQPAPEAEATPEDQVKEEAISTIENSIGTLENAVETLKAVETEETAQPVEQVQQAVEGVKQAFEMFGFTKVAEEGEEEPSDENQEEAMEEVENKVIELAQAVDELKESTDTDTSEAENAVMEIAAAYKDLKMIKIAEEEAEAEAAEAAIEEALDDATEEEVENIISDAYDKAGEILEENGVTLEDYIESKVDDPEVAEEVADTVAKLAAISGQNMYKVADDVLGTLMEKFSTF